MTNSIEVLEIKSVTIGERVSKIIENCAQSIMDDPIYVVFLVVILEFVGHSEVERMR